MFFFAGRLQRRTPFLALVDPGMLAIPDKDVIAIQQVELLYEDDRT